MSSSRRSRRRRERERARGAKSRRGLSLPVRAALVVGGIAVIAGGVLLLSAARPNTARRLDRLAGILILLGLAAIAVGAIGRL